MLNFKFNGTDVRLCCLSKVNGLELVPLKVDITISNLIQEAPDCCESLAKLS